MVSRPYLLSQLISDAAERDGTAPALVDGEQRIDYGELHDRVRRMSAALRSHGVAPGDRVLVHAPKSVDTFVAMHATMHAGGIAVPVNPRSGDGVVRDVVGSVSPAAAVLHPSTAARWPADVTDVVAVGIDPGNGSPHLSWPEVHRTDGAGAVSRTGDDPAYLITTSGSTGAPKSIVHTHRSGLRYAELAADCYGLEPDDRMANVAPFHFDQSTFELYAGPLVGASVILFPEVLLRFPANVAALVESERISVWYSVPTILRQLLERGGLTDDTLASLRWVIFGGELFPPDELGALMARAPAARFSNSYGPAEVNQCTFHHLDRAPGPGESVPIGTTWGDTRARIVDPDSTAATATSGELLIQSATAMAGYWNQPEMTAAAFVDEPGPGGITTRWYRTGDLVEQDTDGRLHFRGRLDRQVKVRGVRLELEAIEAGLNAVSGVSASAAGVTEDGTLAAIVESSTVRDGTALRSEIAEHLGPGAQPDLIEVWQSLPRTGSDKIDHAAVADVLRTMDTHSAKGELTT